MKEKREKIVGAVKSFFSSGSQNNEDLDNDNLSEKREQIIKTIKEKKQWLIYVALGLIIWFSSFIRIQNLKNLKDVTTGKYIPLALDPHLFLKYAKQIVTNGALLAHDPTRFVPVGTSTVNYVFMSSFIAYLYKFLHIFFPSITIEFVDIIYPVICFAIALVFFFLLVRRLFDWKVGLLIGSFATMTGAFFGAAAVFYISKVFCKDNCIICPGLIN